MFRKSLTHALLFAFFAILISGLSASGQEGANPDQQGAGGTISIGSASDVPKWM